MIPSESIDDRRERLMAEREDALDAAISDPSAMRRVTDLEVQLALIEAERRAPSSSRAA